MFTLINGLQPEVTCNDYVSRQCGSRTKETDAHEKIRCFSTFALVKKTIIKLISFSTYTPQERYLSVNYTMCTSFCALLGVESAN